jgi:hypothetical protein
VRFGDDVLMRFIVGDLELYVVAMRGDCYESRRISNADIVVFQCAK